MADASFGSKSYADWNRFVTLDSKNDLLAMQKWAIQKCTLIPRGAQVEIEDVKVPGGAFGNVDAGDARDETRQRPSTFPARCYRGAGARCSVRD